MFSAIRLTNYYTETIQNPLLTLGMIGSNKYQITNIEGLGPVTSEISSLKYPGSDGRRFQSASTGGRNIVITVKYNPDYSQGESPRSLKNVLFERLTPKARVGLEFVGTDVRTNGYVESVEPNSFSRDPSVTISIVSMEAYLTEGDAFTVSGTSNQIHPNLYQSLGGGESGFLLTITPSVTLTRVHITNNMDPWIAYTKNIPAGARFTLSTVPNDKYVRINSTDFLTGLAGSSLEMSLSYTKAQRFQVTTEPSAVPYSIRLTKKLSGIL